MSGLPLEMIAEILCRLPAKELLCCRSVSKPWCALIDGPNFIKIAFKALFGHKFQSLHHH
jgi:hypothetical protein